MRYRDGRRHVDRFRAYVVRIESVVGPGPVDGARRAVEEAAARAARSTDPAAVRAAVDDARTAALEAVACVDARFVLK